MKFGKAYDNAIGLNIIQTEEGKPIPDNISPAEDASRAQRKMDWMQSTHTENLIKKYTEEINNLIAQAMVLATTYSSHQNHFEIINKLIRANELRKLIEDWKKL